MSLGQHVRGFSGRFLALVMCEVRAVRYQPVLRKRSVASLPQRLTAILRNDRLIDWLGASYRYESRFDPIMMHVHQHLVEELSQALPGDMSMRVLDIGANVGQFATAFSLKFPNSLLFSFEPNPSSFELLAKNAEQDSSWKVFPFGVASISGCQDLYYVPGRSGQGSVHRENAAADIWKAGIDDIVSVHVQMVDSNGLLKLIGDQPWTLVKIDVEGAEADVIEVIKELDWRFLLIEIGSERVGVGSESELLTALSQLGMAHHVRWRRNYPKGLSDVLIERVGDTTCGNL